MNGRKMNTEENITIYIYIKIYMKIDILIISITSY